MILKKIVSLGLLWGQKEFAKFGAPQNFREGVTRGTKGTGWKRSMRGQLIFPCGPSMRKMVDDKSV